MSANSDSRRRIRSRQASRPPLWLIYLLLLGPVGLLVLFNYVPAMSALFHAFTRWDVGEEHVWVGLANFRELFRDPVFLNSCLNLFKLGTFIFVVNVTVPFVVADAHARDETFTWVAPDYEVSAYTATRHLVDRGHRRIAFIGSSHVPAYCVQCEASFRRAMRGLPCGLTRPARRTCP